MHFYDGGAQQEYYILQFCKQYVGSSVVSGTPQKAFFGPCKEEEDPFLVREAPCQPMDLTFLLDLHAGL